MTATPPARGRRAAFGLGSNLGDRLASLQAAVDAIAGTAGIHAVGVSAVYETAPVGGPEQPDYLNAVLVVDTELPPRALLEVAAEAERGGGRVRMTRWGPRSIDVDVLAVGGLVADQPDLVVPHPRAAERAFVLVPWAQVDPGAEVPGLGTVAAARDGLDPADLAQVRERADLALVLPSDGAAGPPPGPEDPA